MAYTVMTPKSTGDIPDATDWNHIVNNFIAGAPDIFTTKGDLAVASAANVAVRLPVGTNGQILMADSAETLGIKWGNVPVMAARAKVSTTKALASATTVIVDYDTVDFDTNTAITTGAAWKFTAPSAGYYLVQASAVLESSSAWGVDEKFYLYLYKNGAVFASITSRSAEAAGTYVMGLNGTTIISLAASDYIDIRAHQASGAAINIDADGNMTYVSIARLF